MASTCNVVRSWPDHSWAVCDCGFKGIPRIFFWFAKRDAKRHCKLRGHELGDLVYVRPL